MKKWRNDAEQHNAEAGKKHQGRKNKPIAFQFPKHVSMSTLLQKMFLKTGLQVYYGG